MVSKSWSKIIKDPNLIVDFNTHVTRSDTRVSHLHKIQPLPDPNGNRAERRRAKKKGIKK